MITSPAAVRPIAEIAAERQALALSADPFSEEASTQVAALTRELAAAILAAPLGTKADGLVVFTGGWSAETAARADAAAEPGSAAWMAALGVHEHATLSSDGRGAIRTAWCEHPDGQYAWVQYQHWSAAGCEAHGFVCAGCRKLTQTG